MILNEQGASYDYQGEVYTIGETVMVSTVSEYSGLIGTIIEIRDGDDKETENDTLDIYCRFYPPYLPHDIKNLEENFSALYQHPMRLEDICLDMVIMAPEMLTFPERKKEQNTFKVYFVRAEWSTNGEEGQCISEAYTDFQKAKYQFERALHEELTESASILGWKEAGALCEDFGKNSYTAYLDGEYCENHYSIAIEELVVLPDDIFDMQRADEYRINCRMEDFISQIAEWDEVGKLTEEQYARMIADKSIAERIQSALGKNDSYWESYWQTVSEVAHDEVQKYLVENPHTEEPKPKKLWYTVSFAAKMSDDDVRAMKNCFYDAMDESMGIEECAALDIDLDDDQDNDEENEE